MEEISRATGRAIRFTRIPREAFVAGIAEAGLPEDIVWLLNYLFATVLDGRNASLGDGVQKALGREPRDFADFCGAAASSGAWNRPSSSAAQSAKQ